jgi:hypothetical protein
MDEAAGESGQTYASPNYPPIPFHPLLASLEQRAKQ